jgi:hypothetical protein
MARDGPATSRRGKARDFKARGVRKLTARDYRYGECRTPPQIHYYVRFARAFRPAPITRYPKVKE